MRPPNFADTWSRIQASLTGLNLCSGLNLPFGFHHSAESREKRSTSSASMVVRWASAMGVSLRRQQVGRWALKVKAAK
jgi:hypothetical protein